MFKGNEKAHHFSMGEWTSAPTKEEPKDGINGRLLFMSIRVSWRQLWLDLGQVDTEVKCISKSCGS